jgi:glycosyltransferase involved in cell wall biosynthesis
MSHLLIFEPDPRGHTFEWLACLLRHAASETRDRRTSFVVAPELADRLSSLADVSIPSHVKIIALDAAACRHCLSERLVVSGFARWWSMRRYLKRCGADHGFFLCLDHLSLPLALGLGGGGRTLSGILFRPSTHYTALDARNAPSRGERLRDWRKRILYALMLRNRALQRVLSLDPYFSEMQKGASKYASKIESLADPAFPLSPDRGERHDDVPANRVFFLLFGALTERKGILTLYDALMRLPPGIAGKCAIMIAGRIDPALRSAIGIKALALTRLQPNLWIERRDRFIPDAELDALIRRSNVVLAPYQRFVGSSGAMLRAARAGKPVLTQDYGLLARLAQDYALGSTADTTDPLRLAEAITSLVHNETWKNFDPAGAAAFVAAHAPHAFATAVFGPVIRDTIPHKRGLKSFISTPRTGHASPPP